MARNAPAKKPAPRKMDRPAKPAPKPLPARDPRKMQPPIPMRRRPSKA